MLKKLEDYAKKNNIPIMEKEGIEFLIGYINDNNIKSILEIGSAIGYSAIKMALVCDDITITTIERDETRYLEAVKNIKKFKLSNRIELIHNDALDVNIKNNYDLIFIDAAKSKYLDFFEKFKYNLKPGGVIITDNINFHGLTKEVENIKNKNLKSLIKKIINYVNFLKNNKEFTTSFINVGDGISISKKK